MGLGWPTALLALLGAAAAAGGLWALAVGRLDRRARTLVAAWVGEHAEVLYRKHKQTEIYDDYGQYVPDRFAREVDYFVNRVLAPKAEGCSRRLRRRLRCLLAEESAYVTETIVRTIADTARTRERAVAAFHPGMSPEDFETFCAELLKGAGWHVQRVGRSGDQGVDLIASRNGLRVAVQCKLHARPVGNKAVQEILAGKHWQDADLAIVVSNNAYTRAARQLAGKNHVLLLHYDELAGLDDVTGLRACDQAGEDRGGA